MLRMVCGCRSRRVGGGRGVLGSLGTCHRGSGRCCCSLWMLCFNVRTQDVFRHHGHAAMWANGLRGCRLFFRAVTPSCTGTVFVLRRRFSSCLGLWDEGFGFGVHAIEIDPVRRWLLRSVLCGCWSWRCRFRVRWRWPLHGWSGRLNVRRWGTLGLRNCLRCSVELLL